MAVVTPEPLYNEDGSIAGMDYSVDLGYNRQQTITDFSNRSFFVDDGYGSFRHELSDAFDRFGDDLSQSITDDDVLFEGDDIYSELGYDDQPLDASFVQEQYSQFFGSEEGYDIATDAISPYLDDETIDALNRDIHGSDPYRFVGALRYIAECFAQMEAMDAEYDDPAQYSDADTEFYDEEDEADDGEYEQIDVSELSDDEAFSLSPAEVQDLVLSQCGGIQKFQAFTNALSQQAPANFITWFNECMDSNDVRRIDKAIETGVHLLQQRIR